MTVREVVNKICGLHGPLPPGRETCDLYKFGDPDTVCTGIVTTCSASVGVIRETAKLGANLLICHEPVFYSHHEIISWSEKNTVYEEKTALLRQNGIVVWRDHDHLHAERPDGIMYGVFSELGWLDYSVGEVEFQNIFAVPGLTAREMALHIKKEVGMNAVRLIGNPDAVIRRASFYGHMTSASQERDMQYVIGNDIDLLIPGETLDFTVLSYYRDAGQLGMNKALLQLGHYNMEELGMKHLARRLGVYFAEAFPVNFIHSADMYQYIL